MFQAVLHGKVRDNFASASLNSDWRSLYQQTEDFLTAAIFCRLTYLSADFLWSIIKSTAFVAAPINLPDEAGALLKRTFWPRWNLTLAQDSQQSREPDVFLVFERVALLVEAKLDDGHKQYAEQWAAEMAACVERQDMDNKVPTWLFAIGGMGDHVAPAAAHKMRDEAERILHENYGHPEVSIMLAASSWRHLLGALIGSAEHVRTAAPEGYVIDDLIEILRFHGFRNTKWLGDLGAARHLCGIGDRSLATLGRSRQR